MSGPCNNINLSTIKVSKLVRYSNLDVNDLFLTIESGSALYSRRSTFGDLVKSIGNVTGSYTGSFSGSFKGKSSGSFSGSYWGQVVSKNTKATGSFSGTNNKLSGSFSGSYWGQVVSKNTKSTGSFSGSYWGQVVSKNTKATGSFSGTNNKLSGSFSGSYYGQINSKNTKATGSFSGTNNKLSGSFSGSSYGKIIGANGSLVTGSFRGIDNITNFKGTGKKVSFNGTSSYSVSSSFSTTASYISNGGDIFSNALYNSYSAGTISFTGTDYTIGTITVPTDKTLKWFKIYASVGTGEAQPFYLYGVKLNATSITSNVYSSWGFGRYTRPTDEAGPVFSERQQFTIEGKVPAGVNTGTITFYVNGSPGFSSEPNIVAGYVVGYF